MISERALSYLRSLTYQENAERRNFYMPLVGIYWKDEIPDFAAFRLLPKNDHDVILRLFCIRIKVWRAEALTVDEQALWDSARSLVPICPIFRRIDVSESDRRAQAEVEKHVDDFVEDIRKDADAFTMVERDGFRQFSATLDLTKDKDSESVNGQC